MIKRILPLSSLVILSVFFSLSGSGNHTSISVQSWAAQGSPPPSAVSPDVGQERAKPQIPPFEGHEITGSQLSNVNIRLDGFRCENCVLENAVLIYAGGVTSLKNVKFTGRTVLILDGAARNGLTLLEFVRAMTAPPDDPIIVEPKQRRFEINVKTTKPQNVLIIK